MWGKKLWAPLRPHLLADSFQNSRSSYINDPLGQAYMMYSRHKLESNEVSLTWAKSQSAASWTPRLPVAAKAFSLFI